MEQIWKKNMQNGCRYVQISENINCLQNIFNIDYSDIDWASLVGIDIDRHNVNVDMEIRKEVIILDRQI